MNYPCPKCGKRICREPGKSCFACSYFAPARVAKPKPKRAKTCTGPGCRNRRTTSRFCDECFAAVAAYRARAEAILNTPPPVRGPRVYRVLMDN